LEGRRIIRVIGTGATATVYETVDDDLDRRAALKVLLPSVSNRKVRERFLREAKLAAKVHHAHVVTIYRTGQLRGLPFIEMELLGGVTLEYYLKKFVVCKAGQVVRFARELFDGLAAVHALGITHRDVKPGNVWLAAPSGTVKLLDFGLAHVEDSGNELTKVGTILGTPAYMSPEQARGRPVDFRSDLFSAGIVLYQMATGVLPFVGRRPIDVIAAITAQPHRPAIQLNGAIPAALSDLIDRLLEKDPAKRPASSIAVINAIRGIPTTGTGGSGSTEMKAIVAPQQLVETKDEWKPVTEPIIQLSRYRAHRQTQGGLTALAMILLGVFFGVAGASLCYLRFR
jgi:serine/threonine protein kinase